MDNNGNGLLNYFTALQQRLRRVRVCCGDWRRVLGPSVTVVHGITGIVFDPPYATSEGRDMNIYAVEDGDVAHQVRDWCLEHGNHPQLRIVLCGYDPTHDALCTHGWTKMEWHAHGGMGLQGNNAGRANKDREMLWCSPACLGPAQPRLL